MQFTLTMMFPKRTLETALPLIRDLRVTVRDFRCSSKLTKHTPSGLDQSLWVELRLELDGAPETLVQAVDAARQLEVLFIRRELAAATGVAQVTGAHDDRVRAVLDDLLKDVPRTIPTRGSQIHPQEGPQIHPQEGTKVPRK